MADIFKTLIKKRSSIKSKLTIYSNYLNLIKSSSAISELQRLDLEERFNKFETLHTDFDTLQTQIEVLSDDDEPALAEREDFDRQFLNLVALTRNLLGVSACDAASEAGFGDADSGAHVSIRNSFVRLPKIDLPQFDGNYQCWLEFRDNFGSLIHDNSGISDINKFHYLRASLQGNAALTITKYIDYENGERSIQIKFIDSFQFLSSSLNSLSKSLSDHDFIHLSAECNDENINLLKKKGIYPYDYISTWGKYEETTLPRKKYFYNSLKMEHIT